MQLRALLTVALLSLAAVRSFASSSPVAVKLWPGSPPDETEVGNIGPERVRTNQRPYSKWTVACADWLRDNGFLPMNPRGIKSRGVEQSQRR